VWLGFGDEAEAVLASRQPDAGRSARLEAQVAALQADKRRLEAQVAALQAKERRILATHAQLVAER